MNKNKRTALTANAATAEPPVRQFESVTINLSPSLVRNDTMEGEEFIVAPMVMILEGVHAGSNGPLYYPKEELEKTPAVWNHKPVVVYHPQINGQGVSACDPEILTTHKIGYIMNAKTDRKKINGVEVTRLTAEAWLKKTRIAAVDDRIGEALENNQMMELSTGVFTDNSTETGEWNGESYIGIARNYRPDHLAILPDKIGACSMADGAGFIRNELNLEMKIPEDVLKAVQNIAVKLAEPYLENNELSHGDIRMSLRAALKERYQSDADSDGYIDVWIEEVYDDFFIFEFQNKLWKQDYSKSETTVSVEGEPTQVIATTEYKDLEGNLVGNETTNNNQKQNTKMNKKQIVDKLIENGKWSEDDREFLMGATEKQLDNFQTEEEPTGNSDGKGKNTDKAPTDNKDGKTSDNAPKAEPAGNQPAQNKAQTAEEYINNAPPELRDVLRSSLSLHQTQKSELVEKIVTNENNLFEKAYLEGLGLNELKGIAALLPREAEPVANGQRVLQNDYSGQGDPARPQTNKEEALVTPSWDD